MARPSRKPQLRPGPALPEVFPTLVPGSTAPRRPAFARPAGLRWRHVLALLAFVLMVPVPVALTGWYLAVRAQPLFASGFGFVVHSEGDGAGSGLLAALPAIGAVGSSSSRDTDVLARFLRSQALVAAVDAQIDLRKLWSAGYPADPVFAWNPAGTIEDLTRFWQRMVRVHYDYSAGLMEVEVRSFDPRSAQTIAHLVEAEASRLINRLSAVAREDRLRHATRELERAETGLSKARQALTSFRARQQLIDPMTDLAGALQVIADLQRQLTEESVEMEVLRETLAESRGGKRREDSGDFRIRQSERRIEVIRQRLAEERAKIGGGRGGTDYATLTGEFERLSVAVELAQQSYVTALAAREAARAEADRQSRYVATYAAAGLPERAVYPRSLQILALVAAAALLSWSVVMMIVYGLRDRL